jgi:hypothetical protein
MSSAPTAEEIARDARWLAQALDPGRGAARLVAMDRESYRAASFLDDRLMQQPIDAQILPWPDVEAAVQGELRTDARWIFHIGHVGSTLISRMLGEIAGVLCVREPRLLRDLAVTPEDVRVGYLAPIAKLMSRTFSPEEIACVKATSFASEIAPQLVPANEKALFVYASPRNYVASILAGENSVKELQSLASFRAQRLAGRGITLGSFRNDAERAAAAWACEMTTLETAASLMTDREIDWCDFDGLLLDVPRELGRIAAFLDFEVASDQLGSIADGPLLRRYSKDPKYEYSPSLRRHLVEQELDIRGPEIEAALAMLAAAAEKSPLLTRALSRAEGV